MSASNKKKLRKEQETAKLTEKQLAAQKEAKKTNLYTIAFIAAMVVILVVAITVGITQTIVNSGIREKNTTALTVNDHEISNAELNYFYIDAVNTFYSNYGSYAALFGMDVTKPLNEQVTNEETGATWADDFLTSASDSAKAVYTVVDEAKAAGFTLTEDQRNTIEINLETLETYAMLYGYSEGEQYLKAMYGNGATVDSYREYLEMTTLFNAYQQHYAASLTYEDADLRAKEAEDFNAYSSYSYNTYYLAASRFLEGGTTAEDGTTTYSDEEKAASVAAAEEAAKALTSEEITDLAAFDAAVAALEINKDTESASTAYENTLYTSVSSTYSQWLTDASRKAGDVAYFPSTSTTTDDSGNETTVTNGYYVVFFNGMTDNTFALKNVRHILAAFEGGTTDPNTGVTTYTDEAKAAAKAEAEALLADWQSGKAIEETFAALANEKSDDGDGTTGGLYENVYPNQMVKNFNDWCFDENRKAGDTGIVETEYGYHVMFFVGDSDTNYRDFLIENDLRAADAESWYTALLDAAATTEGDTRYLPMDLVLNAG